MGAGEVWGGVTAISGDTFVDGLFSMSYVQFYCAYVINLADH
jgi:hypothetical protein